MRLSRLAVDFLLINYGASYISGDGKYQNKTTFSYTVCEEKTPLRLVRRYRDLHKRDVVR